MLVEFFGLVGGRVSHFLLNDGNYTNFVRIHCLGPGEKHDVTHMNGIVVCVFAIL